ncbi:hypothetical protein [Streptomyces avicenniae]|uniref:hypothetical protein n=1 Tax=Streptomyces avicenniae TaxID=500153 RepID=UPI000ADBCFF6|nr:hypothetical protein [Streptomyces avicenniae]
MKDTTTGTTHEPPATRRSPVRARLVGVALIALSLFPAWLGHMTFTDWLPSTMDRYRDYGAAEPCPGPAATGGWEDCLRTVTFTVRDTDTEPRGLDATLDGTDFWNGTVRFGDQGPVLDRLRPGEQVTGTVWRGRVMALSRDDARQSTSDEPRDEPQMTAAAGTGAALLAALLLGFGAVRLARPLDHRPFTWRPYGNLMLGVVAAGPFAVGIAALLTGLPWWTVPPAAVALAVCAARLLHRWRRPAPVRGS